MLCRNLLAVLAELDRESYIMKKLREFYIMHCLRTPGLLRVSAGLQVNLWLGEDNPKISSSF